MSKMTRISRTGEHQIRKGHKWLKPSASKADPKKLKEWRELAEKRKHKKEED